MDSSLTPFPFEQSLEYVIFDGRFRILVVSNGATRFSDEPGSLVVGEDIRISFPELVGLESELQSFLKATSSTITLRNISRSKRDDHTSICIDVSLDTTRVDGTPALVMTIEDVSERMSLEQTLVQQSNESKLLLQAMTSAKTFIERIIDSLADALFVTSPEGVIITVNKAATHLFGYHKGELIGISIQRLLGDSQLLNNGIFPITEEVLCISKEGETIPISFSCSSLEESEFKRGIIFLGRDLRERKSAEAEIRKLRTENVYLNEELQAEHNFEEIIGTTPVMKKLFRQIQKVAVTDSTVLLQGETGTGKELFARAIHNRSGRNENVLVKVNCAALPSGLVESELFGHEKGAFTGASSRKIGRFEFADGGTIFLDEISELPLETQVKLLRVLQEREFERVGGTEVISTNVRVIAATNRNLNEQVQLGVFRADLYYRLNVFPVEIPPLRERKGDIPFLSDHFVKKFARRMNKRIEGIDADAMTRMMKYDWPGNVRELAAALERAIILCDGGLIRNIDIISLELPKNDSSSSSLQEVERNHILAILHETNGVIEGKNGAAIRLNVNASTLRSRMKKLEIRRRGKEFE